MLKVISVTCGVGSAIVLPGQADQLLPELRLETKQLHLCLYPARVTLVLNADRLLQRGDQVVVDLAQGLDIHDPALSLAGHLGRTRPEHLGVLREQLVRRVGDGLLQG